MVRDATREGNGVVPGSSGGESPHGASRSRADQRLGVVVAARGAGLELHPFWNRNAEDPHQRLEPATEDRIGGEPHRPQRDVLLVEDRMTVIDRVELARKV